MKKLLSGLTVMLMLIFSQLAVQAQTTGSIAGTVIDPNGAVVPNATVTVKGQSGQEFTASTGSNGLYNIPAVPNGLYTVTISATGFKTSATINVKVNVGSPTTVDTALEIGDVGETVEITSGGEVLQTQTATVGTTITGRQITETPIASRDALDLVGLLPGTATVGAPRRSSINGLPKGSLSITIDGVDVQDNLLRSSDGYFTYVRPRIDAIEEVTVSTANPGAESGGDGAVQIRFVTRRGTNDYNGGLFWQHRNTALNANYWYLNRDGQRDDNGKALRQKIILNQYGGNFGGPIPFFHFGEGGPFITSGKDKRYFFVNYEEFRQPESLSRTRVILTPDAQAGNFSYIVGGQTVTRNLYTIATGRNCAPTGQPFTPCVATPDPTVGALLARIRAATGTTGTITPITNSPNALNYNFSPAGGQVRKFLALRFDFNLTKDHSLEFVTNRQKFVPSKDFLNSQDERFPGFPSYTQGSSRNSYSTALRSTFGRNIVNEARFAVSTGLSEFSAGISSADFDFQGGYALGINAASGITTATSRNSYSNRNTPTYDFTDTVNWIAGSHSISFGGQYKLIRAEGSSIGRIVPTVSFGLDSNDPAFNIFNNVGCTQTPVPPTCTLPGASSAQLTEARGLYATLIGRVTGYTSTAFLTPDGTYKENAEQARLAKQNTYGLFVQDSWRVNPNLTVNYGVRWQPQTAFVALSKGIYTRLENFDQVFGVSGSGNLFKPGTLTGSAPRVVALEEGEKAYPDDWNNLAPTVGVVWSPSFGDTGFLKTLFGSSGKSVFRGGYSISYVREGFNVLESILGSNPGGSLSASKSPGTSTVTNPFIIGTNLRDPNNPNLRAAPFPSTPSFPISLALSDSTNAFSPDLKTGSVHSFSFGYQRELDKNTVVEVRYVGNRGRGLQRQYDINEFNTIENGFAAEFALAQANLYANIAAGRGASFAYFGAGSGTSPLPILLSFFNPATGPTAYDPNNAARYLPTNFTNTTLVTALSRNAPNIFAFSGTNFVDNATRRTNGIANGRASNFFYVNPTTAPTNIGGTIFGGSFVVDNSTNSWYDSGVIELRRRLSAGLRVQASYVWSKAQSNAFQSSSVVFAGFTQRENGLELAKNVQAFDIRHQFKFDATYELPFGRGRQFFSDSNGFVNGVIGGWTIFPTIRWQSGSPFNFGNVQLVGMTREELQKEIKVRKGENVVTYLPDDIILNTRRAFNVSVTSPTGYLLNGDTTAPTGKFLAPAGFGNCISRFVGECGYNSLIVYGPGFFKFDAALSKRFNIGEKRNVEFRATFLDVLNAPNFRVGGFGADVINVAVGGATFGQLGNGSAYQDVSTTNDPGGRLIDLMLRIHF